MIEDFFTLKEKGSDGKSDTHHLRNSISHGRFQFISDGFIEFIDVDEKGNETFRKKLNSGDLLGVYNMFEMKLHFALLYFIIIQLRTDCRDELGEDIFS